MNWNNPDKSGYDVGTVKVGATISKISKLQTFPKSVTASRR